MGPHNQADHGAAEIDLSLCAAEPIHRPGAIQPHGALIAARAGGLVSHASANLADFIGLSARQALGTAVHQVLGAPAWQALVSGGLEQPQGVAHAPITLPSPRDAGLVLRAHRSGDHICIDIERAAAPQPAAQLVLVQPILDSFRRAGTIAELCDLAVRGLRDISGYDRVMAYRFGPAGDGEVIAEARADWLSPYLGQHYPASDIPAQARRQYIRQSVGMIADAGYQPVPLLAAAEEGDAPLDLTYSGLRSVSPVHRQYMRNMDTAASLTIALTLGEALWGLLVCHHATPRVAGLELRAAAGMIGQVAALLLAGLQETEAAAQRRLRDPIMRTVRGGLGGANPMKAAIAEVGEALRQVVGADAGLARLGGEIIGFGPPPPPGAEHLLARLQAEAGGQLLALDQLADRAAALPQFCGALLLPLGHGTGDALLWLRGEHATTVTWGGNPEDHATRDPVSGQLSPRVSFTAWKAEVKGRSAAWSHADQELAREVGHAVEMGLAQRTRLALVREQAAGRAKSRFLAGMSHELRTPLNGILGYAQLLGLEGGLSAVQSGRVAAMLTAGRHLLAVINRVLQLSEIEADEGTPEAVPCDPRGLAAECLDLVRPLATAKSLALSLAAAPDVPPLVTTDPTRLRQVLLNLLGNAVKFTVRGGIELRLGLLVDGATLQLEVADSGPGIDPAKRHRLFREFDQLGAPPEGGSGSAGLGLAIAARLVARLEGRIGYRDNPAGGSIFWAAVPIGRAVAAAAAAPAAGLATPLAPLSALVVDDSAVNRDIAAAFLSVAGHRVAFAEDGLAAVAAVAAADYDVVLMDIRMPRMDGLQATRAIRALGGSRGAVPIVALTAHAFAEQVEECRAATMDGHLAKPFTMEGLLTAMQQAVGARRAG